ncbi:MAG: succinate dehydrogenase iron-sulfur subunit [Elusimicrobia bacterium]|nr:succinate dehydrogenase iron-sulfur subunit [Elusimicrobiota bacterium]
MKVKVSRFDPDKSPERYFSEYELEVSEGMTVLDGLIWLKENADPTISFRYSCRMGVCGSCAMMINSYPHLACHTQILEITKSVLVLEPLCNHANVRDLICDFSAFFEKHRTIKPHLLREDAEKLDLTGEISQTPQELESYLQFSYCIKCGICVAACPTCATDKEYLGPQALAQAYRYTQDSRDAGGDKRIEAAAEGHGIHHCHYAGACSEACPKGVDPAFAIQLFRKQMVLRSLGLKETRPPAGEMPPMTLNPKPNIPKPPEPTIK